MTEPLKQLNALKFDIARTVVKSKDAALCKMLVCCGVVDWRTYAGIVYQALSPVSVTLVDSKTHEVLYRVEVE